MSSPTIPRQAETLQVLRLMGNEPIIMLGEHKDEFGTRWTLCGEEVQPAIACFLMKLGFIAVAGKTELGAHQLSLTDKGLRFRREGLAWWAGLSFLEKVKIIIFG